MNGAKHTIAEQTPTVLVDLAWQQPGRQELCQRIALALRPVTSRIFTTEGKSPITWPIDVVISERPDALTELSATALGTTETAARAGAVGLVLLGSTVAKTDAALPLDFSDRELAQVCRLVGEIVALRRRSLEFEKKGHEMARLATIDSLTRLANRRAWDEEAPERLRQAILAGREICLAIFDVDHFKAINDTRGHATGDAALAAMGSDISGLVPTEDLVARVGGDEFAALFVGRLDPPGPLAIVERIRLGVGRQQTARLGFELSLSAGCAAIGTRVPMPEGAAIFLASLCAKADAALRRAKSTGRNRTVLASENRTS